MFTEVLRERLEDGLVVEEEVFGPSREWKGSADDFDTINVRVEQLPILEGGLGYEELSRRSSVC